MPISTLKKINLTDKVKKYRVVMEDEVESKMELQDGRARQFAMLKAIVDNPALLFCGSSHFHKMSMTHTGEKWLIELESIVEEKEAKP